MPFKNGKGPKEREKEATRKEGGKEGRKEGREGRNRYFYFIVKYLSTLFHDNF